MKYSISTLVILFVSILIWPISAASVLDGLPVVDENGRRTMIGFQARTHVIAVATWCGYSEEFVNMVRDPRVAKYLTGDTFYFVLGNEWPEIEQSIDAKIASGELDASAKAGYKRQLEALADPVVLANPAFLHDLPGDHFFVETFPGELGFPSRYAPGMHPFEDHAVDALIDAGVPVRVLEQVMRELRRGY